MKNLTIDDILNDKTPPVQSLKKAELDEKEKNEAAAKAQKFESKGRPKVNEENKKRARSFYLSDVEFQKIEKIANLSGMSVMDFVRFALLKELRKEGVEL